MPSLSESAPWGLLHPQWGRAGPPRIRTWISVPSPFTTEWTQRFGGVVSETFGGELREGWSLLSLDAPKGRTVRGTVTAPRLPAKYSVRLPHRELRPPHRELRPKTWKDGSRILLSLFFLCSYLSSLTLHRWFSIRVTWYSATPSPGPWAMSGDIFGFFNSREG